MLNNYFLCNFGALIHGDNYICVFTKNYTKFQDCNSFFKEFTHFFKFYKCYNLKSKKLLSESF